MRRTFALTLTVPLVLFAAAARPDPVPAASLPPPAPVELPSPWHASQPSITSDPAGPAATEGSSDDLEDAALGGSGNDDPTVARPPGSGSVGSDDGSTTAPPTTGPLPDASPAPAPGPPPAGGPVEDTFLIAAVPDGSAVAGTTGRLWRYTVEVEPSLGLDVDEVAAIVRAALTDDRSWARTRTLEQVTDPSKARIRVVLATPDTVDELCGRAGLRTVGIYSCWNGRFAALNSWRWDAGANGFPDIETYRNYLVNHEFGHGLGYGHVGCPREGALAPVMMQQSMRLDGCVANGWPYP